MTSRIHLHSEVIAAHHVAFERGQTFAQTHPPAKTSFQAAQEAAETAYSDAGAADNGASRATFVVVFLAGWLK